MSQKTYDPAITQGTDGVDFFNSVLEASTEYAIIATDLSGKVQVWNEGAKRLFGYEAGEVLSHINAFVLFELGRDVSLGEITDTVLRNGRWSGTLTGLTKSHAKPSTSLAVTSRKDLRDGPLVSFWWPRTCQMTCDSRKHSKPPSSIRVR